MGSWMGTAFALSLSWTMSITLKKFAPMMSILLI